MEVKPHVMSMLVPHGNKAVVRVQEHPTWVAGLNGTSQSALWGCSALLVDA